VELQTLDPNVYAAAVHAYEQALAESLAVHPPEDWVEWLHYCFPHYATYGFAPHHQDFWDWVWRIQKGQTQEPFVAIWARGGAKSSSVEMSIAALAARGARRYGLYISESQKQADDHVSSVSRMFESPSFGAAYPRAQARALGLYGNPLGWRQNRLRTASGFTLDAVGLDAAARGVKLDENRPDLLIFDDVDSELESDTMVLKKIELITKKLLPTGSEDVVVLAVQNLVHDGSVFHRLALAPGEISDTGIPGADWLADRQVSGPVPALRDAEYRLDGGRWHIIRGEPSWEGQDVAWCQREIVRTGLESFKTECQHDVGLQKGGMYDSVVFEHCTPAEVPSLVTIGVAVDPAVTDKDDSDANGIQVDGLASDGRIYRLYSWEERTSPDDVIRRGLLKAVEFHASFVTVETDQGGDLWKITYQTIWKQLLDEGLIPADTRQPLFRDERAGTLGPKTHRQSQMRAEYGHDAGKPNERIVHVMDPEGTWRILERALRRFPKVKPLDLADAAFWSWRALRHPAPVMVVGEDAPLPSDRRAPFGGTFHDARVPFWQRG
jgi:hypothetical protein